MVKKRQVDFSKSKPKVGRPVGRKRNVTNTSFKAKKIVIPPNRALKDVNQSTKTIKDYLQAMKPTSKPKEFDELRKLIENDTNLPLYLPDIFNSVFKIILEGHLDENQKNSVVDVINAVFVHTTDLQIHSYIPRFIIFLSCAMTHNNHFIKDLSLKVLDSVLRTHHNLICNSMDILTNLLNMVMKHRKRTQSTKSPGKSSLDIVISNPNWRIDVLSRINLFLFHVLQEKLVVGDHKDNEQEIYWDCNEPLHMEIYEGGGLKPVDIEKSLPSDFDYNDFCFDDVCNIETFIVNIINVLPEVFIEEISSETKFDDNLISGNSIANLSVLFQVLSKVSEWMHLLSYDQMDSPVRKFLQESVWDKGRFPFYQRGVNVQDISGVRLNLAVSYLFGKFLLDENREDKEKKKDRKKDKKEDDKENNKDLNDSIFSYIMKVFKMGYAIKYDSIPMLVKIMKIYFEMRKKPKVSEFLRDYLAQLCGLLKGNTDNPNEQLLSSLFIKLSLDPAYDFLSESDALKHWFDWLFNQLMEIPKLKDNSKINRKLLNAIKKIANQKYQYFMELLQKNESKIVKSLLTYDDDDVRDTAIFLIYNMRDISPSLLQHLYHFIVLDSKVPTKYSVRLIRLLACRFLEKQPEEFKYETSIHTGPGIVNIMEFLLNVAIGYSMTDYEKWADYEANEYTKAIEIFKDGQIPYAVFPSLRWKEHSMLFEACFKFLIQLDNEIVYKIADTMVKEIMVHANILPMHSVIAILRLYKHKKIDQYFRLILSELKFCALLTTSVLTHIDIEEEWYKWNVSELMDIIHLDCKIALETLNRIQVTKDDHIDGIVGYHILRVIKFYLEGQFLDQRDFGKIFHLMKVLEKKTSDKTIGRQPLYITLYRHFSYYA